MPHLDEGALTALLDGELGAEEHRQAEEHLAACAECRRIYEDVRSLAGEADQLVDSLQPAERVVQKVARPGAGPRWSQLRPIAWAATLVIAAGLGWSASARRFGTNELARPASDLVDERTPAAPTEPTLPRQDRAGPLYQDAREQVPSKQDDSPRRQATEPPAPPAAPGTGIAKAPAAAAAEADQARNAVGRLESARANPPAAAPAAALIAEPSQARASEAAGARDALGPVGGYEETSLEQAVRVLGGTVKLIDGLTPTRVQIGPPERPHGGQELKAVRITYLDPPGRELWLDQQRSPVPDEAQAARLPAVGILAGDTLVTAAGTGLTRVSWISPDGFRLTLTGYLPGDSLRILVLRVH